MVLRKLVKNFVDDDSGATAIEYGIFAALISVVIIAAVTGIGGQLKTTFEGVEDALTPPPAATGG